MQACRAEMASWCRELWWCVDHTTIHVCRYINKLINNYHIGYAIGYAT